MSPKDAAWNVQVFHSENLQGSVLRGPVGDKQKQKQIQTDHLHY